MFFGNLFFFFGGKTSILSGGKKLPKEKYICSCVLITPPPLPLLLQKCLIYPFSSSFGICAIIRTHTQYNTFIQQTSRPLESIKCNVCVCVSVCLYFQCVLFSVWPHFVQIVESTSCRTSHCFLSSPVSKVKKLCAYTKESRREYLLDKDSITSHFAHLHK